MDYKNIYKLKKFIFILVCKYEKVIGFTTIILKPKTLSITRIILIFVIESLYDIESLNSLCKFIISLQKDISVIKIIKKQIKTDLRLFL